MHSLLSRLLRASAAAAGIVGPGIILAGCVGYSSQAMDRSSVSIKDEPARATSALRKAAKPSSMSPRAARYEPAAKVELQRDLADCGASSDCLARLKALVEDPQRSWIGRPQSPAEYADGTRLFAYRALRDRLGCGELAMALVEINAAAKIFREPVAGVSADQMRRIRALNAEVEAELRAARTSRCGA